MKRILTNFLVFSLLCAPLWASDTHQDGEGHGVTYTLLDSNGAPVSGQTVNLSVKRVKDGAYLDFNDNTFKFNGWTTLNQAMSYDANAGYYWRVVSVDNSDPLYASDYVCTVSNDNVTYLDKQSEVVDFESTNNLVKIHR